MSFDQYFTESLFTQTTTIPSFFPVSIPNMIHKLIFPTIRLTSPLYCFASKSKTYLFFILTNAAFFANYRAYGNERMKSDIKMHLLPLNMSR